MNKPKARIWKPALIFLTSALAAFFLLTYLGKINDCAPNQIDGQCGLASGMGMFFGAILGAVIFLAGVIFISIRLSHQRKPDYPSTQNNPK